MVQVYSRDNRVLGTCGSQGRFTSETNYIWRERPSGLALRHSFSSPYIPQLVTDALQPANMGKVGNSSAQTVVFPSEGLSL
jgi:hypothetical protein